MKSHTRSYLSLALVLALAFSLLAPFGSLPVTAASPNIVISQVYGGGGNSGAPLKNDFVELFNLGTTAASLSGWSIQYASATGTGNFGGNPIALLSGTLQPGQYYLIQLAGGVNGIALPTPDATGTVNMSGTGGKVALVNTTTGLACNGGSAPCSPSQLTQIVDLVGWDSANFYETAPAPATTSSTAVIRNNGGCSETDNNSADFAVAAPSPRNTASPFHFCTGPTNPSGVGAANPNTLFAGDSILLTMAVTPGNFPASTGLVVICDLTAIGGSENQPFYDNAANGDVTAGDNTFSFAMTVAVGTTGGAKSLACTVGDDQMRTSNATIGLTVIRHYSHRHGQRSCPRYR